MEDNEIYNPVDESPLISLEDIVVEYRKSPTEQVRALDHVSLSIWQGEFVAIYGPPESGKTSLLQVLSCMDRPTSGRVVIDGEDISELPTNRLPGIRSEKFGFLFHQHHLISTLTIIENVMLPLRYRKMTQAESEQHASEWLIRVGLGNRMYHRPSELSGVEQQRAALARALVNNAVAIVADEPTGDLDANPAREFIELMRGLNYTFGQTYIIATNNEEIAEMCDRIVRIRQGKIEDDTSWHVTYDDEATNETLQAGDAADAAESADLPEENK